LRSRFLLLRHNRPTKPPAEATSGSVAEGLALSQAVVQKLPGGASLWLIPGTQETCLAFVDTGESYARTSFNESCQDSRTVLKYGVYIFISSATHEYIFGVQPGNARTVTATTNDGQKMKAEARYGVYTLVTRRPKYIRTLSTPGGPTPVTTPSWH
jgi:dipeptidyl aminopeptidase/acylaminoacyl peptidase